jgi:RNA polymerase sigma factor (sigma-70 family)
VRLLLDRHTSGRPEAEDLFQDVFRLALEKLRRGELREPDKLPGFLAQIARSLAIEHYRKLGRRKTDADSEALLTVPASAEDPLAELLDRENAALVRQVLGDLGTPRDRDVLLRFYLAGTTATASPPTTASPACSSTASSTAPASATRSSTWSARGPAGEEGGDDAPPRPTEEARVLG